VGYPINKIVTFSDDSCQLNMWMTNRHRHLPNGLPPNQGYRRQSDLQANLDSSK